MAVYKLTSVRRFSHIRCNGTPAALRRVAQLPAGVYTLSVYLTAVGESHPLRTIDEAHTTASTTTVKL